MKPRSFHVLAGVFAAAAIAAFVPRPSPGQAGADDPLLTPLLAETAKQQALMAENQNKIDEKLALIAEDLRLARIFVGRGGGNTKAK